MWCITLRLTGLLYCCTAALLYCCKCVLLYCCIAAHLADEVVNQNEVLTIAGVSSNGRSVTVQEAVQFNHYGEEHRPRWRC